MGCNFRGDGSTGHVVTVWYEHNIHNRSEIKKVSLKPGFEDSY